MAKNNGVLDLSKVEPSPVKVKLPDGNLYDMANPEGLGVLPMQRLISRYRRAEVIMGETDATEEDVEEMLELLVDVCNVIIPDAERELLGRLNFTHQQKLVEAFFDAFPTETKETAATKVAATSAS